MTARRHGAALLLAPLLAACSVVASPTPQPTLSPSAVATLGPSPSASATAGESAAATPMAMPGRPYDGATILAAMRDSRRPGGVPDQLETDAIAAAVANEIWTLDGEPWAAIAIGGSCGDESCTLDVSGSAAGAVADDSWTLEITPSTATVSVSAANLRSLPPTLVDQLDAGARAADTEGILTGLVLTSAAWSPPPQDGSFRLSYRSGDEEGSAAVDVDFEPATGTMVVVDEGG